jgi:hypothetical protein
MMSPPEPGTGSREPLRRWRAAAIALDLALFLAGMLVYLLSGRTPRLSFHAMRRLYGPTHGLLHRSALSLARRLRPWRGPAVLEGFLGTISAPDIARLVESIDTRGYAEFDRVVPSSLCDSLLKFATEAPCLPLGGSEPVIYPGDKADALRYDFSERSLVADDAACRIIFDGTLAAIAGAYFRCRPVYDFAAMWWTTRFGRRDLSAAAQEFHFDLDRLHFLKFFIYLTDVTPLTGPHVYVEGSHESKPAHLSDPTRFSDASVEASYPTQIRTICGPRGSIFAVDTRGLHKGMPVVDGHRLVFQVEFTISKFGQNYQAARVDARRLRELGIAASVDRRIFRDVVAEA